MVFVANALAPPVVGRVLLLSIVTPGENIEAVDSRLRVSRDVTENALKASFRAGLRPDTLTTIAEHPWEEIERVAKTHHCRSMLLGLSNLEDVNTSQNLEKLVRNVKSDVVVFRQPYTGWKITEARKILIPVAGFSSHDPLRARIAASLWRASQPEITFMQLLPSNTPDVIRRKNETDLARFSGRIIPGKTITKIILSDDINGELVRQASEYDLVIMGLGKPGSTNRVFGRISISLAKETDTALIFISKK
jgi:basic amino acid/polyamine antiporter, APA family